MHEHQSTRRVKILGGMREFVGRTGEAHKEGKLWRVYLDAPVDVAGVGSVTDDLWEGHLLRTIRGERAQ